MQSKRISATTKRALIVVCATAAVVGFMALIIQKQRTFHPDHFEKITPGMDALHVRDLLGEPDKIVTISPGVERWRYDEGKGLATIAQYYITLQDERVITKEIDSW